jgi:hypothetical protein
MSISTPPQGSHFSDGVRTGPIIGSTFVPGANVLSPSVQISSPIDQLPPGIFNTPMSLLDIIPAPTSSDSIAAGQTPTAADYLTLVTTNGIGISVITYQGISNVLQLDCARNIFIVGSAGTTSQTFTVFGWDQYGIPLVEQITGPTGATTAIGNKAFLYIQAVYVAAGTGANVSVGVGNTFGLPYLITSQNYPFVPYWNGWPDAEVIDSTLGANSITTTNGSTIVSVSLAGSDPDVTTAGMVVGQWITISGATDTNGITAAQLNVTAQIIAIPSSTSFTYETYGTATASGTGGGASTVLTFSNTVVTGDQRVATGTTGDVRGTYTPNTAANGFNRLTINFYNASGDARNYNSASNGTVNLNVNPITTTNTSATVSVYAPNHQFTAGENVTIAGAATTNGITAAQLNITAPITIVDADNFTYVSNGVASSTGQGGGSVVTMTPEYGNLYQTSTGRFGVTQYSVAFF